MMIDENELQKAIRRTALIEVFELIANEEAAKALLGNQYKRYNELAKEFLKELKEEEKNTF